MNDNKKRGGRGKKRALIIALSVAAVGGIAYFAFGGKRDAAAVTYSTYRVQTGDIRQEVHGAGSISSAQTAAYAALAGGTGAQVNAAEGDRVSRGDLIAVIDADTDNSRRLSQIEDAMTKEHMTLTRMYTSSDVTKVYAPASGRVKLMRASVGEDVYTLQQGGALCVISTDGKMFVEFEPAQGVALMIGQRVDVSVESDTLSGEVVRTAARGKARVLIGTDIYDDGAAAAIADAQGKALGEGTLRINAPSPVVATGGYVKTVSAVENAKVSKGAVLMQLVHTGLESGYAGALGVIAPDDGLISGLSVAESAEVAANETLFNLLGADRFTLTVSVDELDIAAVKVGQSAAVTVDALGDAERIGTVLRVSAVGAASGGVAMYDVVIALDDVQGVLPGMSASADISTAASENAVLVPVGAIRNVNGKKYVLSASAAANAEQAAPGEGLTEVETGLNDGTHVEILNGLSAGDEIAIVNTTSGNDRLGGFDFGGGGGVVPDAQRPGGGQYPRREGQ